MYLGKAEAICISGFYKQSVIDAARQYLLEHDGFSIWKDIYFDYKWMGWLTWKKEYKIDLYRPIDYEIRRIKLS